MIGISKPRSCIIYGLSGSGKTSELARIAKWIKQKYGLKSRLISASSGGWAPFEDSGLIDPDNPTCSKEATVQAFDITYREYALANIRQLSEGYWPRLLKDKSGKTDLYLQSDANCLTSNEDWEQIGAYLVEGTTDISDVWLNHIRNSKSKVGFSASYEYKEEGYQINGIQDGHYGIVQQELDKVIRQGFHRLPIKWDIWTGMLGYFSPTGRDRDGSVREKHIGHDGGLYGPKAAGQALLPQIPGWFGDCFHLDMVEVEETVKNEVTGINERKLVKKRVAWFTEHRDDGGIKYLAKSRLVPELVPSLLKRFQYGFVELGYTKGLEQYFDTLDEIRVMYLDYLNKKGKPPEDKKEEIENKKEIKDEKQNATNAG